MKKILIILITIPLIFNSCKKEDDTPNSGSNNTSGSIIGTWKIEDFTNTVTEGYIDPVSGTEVVTDTDVYSGPSVNEQSYLTFNSDNSFLNHNFQNDILVPDGINYGNYTKNGSEIILDYMSEDVNIILTITQLTNTNLSCNLLNPGELLTYDDTTYFYRVTGVSNMSKSNIPSITITPLNKKKPVNCYKIFFDRRKK